MEEPTRDTQERELITPDGSAMDDGPSGEPLPDDNDVNDIQDAEILPLQADDNSEASLTMMRGETDGTDTNGAMPNDMLVVGGVVLAVVLLTLMTLLLLKQKPSSTSSNSESDEQ